MDDNAASSSTRSARPRAHPGRLPRYGNRNLLRRARPVHRAGEGSVCPMLCPGRVPLQLARGGRHPWRLGWSQPERPEVLRRGRVARRSRYAEAVADLYYMSEKFGVALHLMAATDAPLRQRVRYAYVISARLAHTVGGGPPNAQPSAELMDGMRPSRSGLPRTGPTTPVSTSCPMTRSKRSPRRSIRSIWLSRSRSEVSAGDEQAMARSNLSKGRLRARLLARC